LIIGLCSLYSLEKKALELNNCAAEAAYLEGRYHDEEGFRREIKWICLLRHQRRSRLRCLQTRVPAWISREAAHPRHHRGPQLHRLSNNEVRELLNDDLVFDEMFADL
jgi:hypothetical protein